MKCRALFLGTLAVVMLNLPTFAADGASSIVGVRWGKNAFNFEGMPSGPQPLKNLSRRPDGKANAGRLVGDYRNPILTPQAAAVYVCDAAWLRDAADDGRQHLHCLRSKRQCSPHSHEQHASREVGTFLY